MLEAGALSTLLGKVIGEWLGELGGDQAVLQREQHQFGVALKIE